MIITKKTLYKFLFTLIFLLFVVRFLTENWGLTYIIMPIFDIYALFVLVLAYFLDRNRDKRLHILETCFLLYVFVSFLSILVNDEVSISNIFYSIRPYFRMIIAMIISAIVLTLERVETFYKYIEWVLYINVFLMTYQFIFMGLRQDIIGGTFGNTAGCNTIQNILCVFVFCVTVELYLRKIFSRRKLILNTVVVLYIAILAELQVIVFELVIIGVVLLLLNKVSIKKISMRTLFLISIGLICVVGGMYFFIKFNPDRVFLLSFENMLEYLGFNGGNTGVYRISRIKVFSQLGNSFFKRDIVKWILGFGLGNCSTHSSFYNAYQDLQYTFFSSSFVFLETGICGVVVNIGTLLTGIFIAFKEKQNLKSDKQKAWMDVSIAMILIFIIMFFYNGTLRDIYTAYFSGTLAVVPYIISKGNMKHIGNK